MLTLRGGHSIRETAEDSRGFPANRRVVFALAELIAFVVGICVLGGVWVLTEYFEEHAWPDRFADSNDVAGTWSPWFFWAVGVWALILAVHAFRTFAHRPPTTAEIARELERLRSRP